MLRKITCQVHSTKSYQQNFVALYSTVWCGTLLRNSAILSLWYYTELIITSKVRRYFFFRNPSILAFFPVLQIRDVYPRCRPNSFHPGSWIQKDSGSRIPILIKNLSILTQTNFSKLSVLFPDPDLDFLPIPDPGVQEAPDPGSGTLFFPRSTRKHKP